MGKQIAIPSNTSRKGSKNKRSKYSADILAEFNFDPVEALLEHYEDLGRRIEAENAAYAPRQSLLLVLAKEQSATMTALAPYSAMKPTGEAPVEETAKKPLAIKLSN